MRKFFCNGADSECNCPILCADCKAADWTGGAEIKTNADRIRAMSDEELATFISEIADECERNTECNQHFYGCDIEYCVRESCLKWLQQPAQEDDHDA